jgi:hypothetical protein
LPNPPAGIVSSLGKKPVVRVEADVGAAILRRRVEKRPKVPRISAATGSVKTIYTKTL